MRIRWVIALSAGLALAAALSVPSAAVASATTSGRVTIWVQTADSCRNALHGARQTIHEPNGHSFNIGPSAGTRPVPMWSGACPAPKGNCVITRTGCSTFSVAVPAKVPVRYTITQNTSQAAPGTVPCNGGSACRGEKALFIVYPSGAVRARVTNTYPDGTTSWYPSSTGYATGTQANPILFHDFVLGNGSCDGDHDADDHLTGAPSSHCDSDRD